MYILPLYCSEGFLAACFFSELLMSVIVLSFHEMLVECTGVVTFCCLTLRVLSLSLHAIGRSRLLRVVREVDRGVTASQHSAPNGAPAPESPPLCAVQLVTSAP